MFGEPRQVRLVCCVLIILSLKGKLARDHTIEQVEALEEKENEQTNELVVRVALGPFNTGSSAT